MATVYSLICFGGRAGKTVTFTDAGDVVNLTRHGLRNGTGVVFSTTGSLPTGLTAGTTYYARQGADDNKFTLHASQADAVAGTGQVTFTGTGSGTHTVHGAYFLSLSAEQKARYGEAGSERIYNGILSFVSGRSTASAYDTEICEIGEAFDDIVTDMVILDVPCAALTVTTMMDGARSAAWHGGVPGAGYIIKRNPMNAQTILNIATYDCTVDGFSVMAAGTSTANMTGVNASKNRARVLNMLSIGKFDGYGNGFNIGTDQRFHNNVAIGWAMGFRQLQYNSGSIVTNNIACKNTTGFGGSATTAIPGFYYNNISIGNTTDWQSVSGTEGASHNAGLEGEAWVVGTGTRLTIATTDFRDYDNNDFYPAASTSPQVETGLTYHDPYAQDLADAVRPAYMGGAAANYDVGPFEFDHGYGLAPNVVPVDGTGIVDGSRVKIAKQSDGAELRNVLLSGATTDSFDQDAPVDIPVYIYARKGSEAPFYKPVRLSASISAESGLTYNLAGLQIEDIARASSYPPGLESEWSFSGGIAHISGTTRYTVRELYSFHQNYFDDAATISDNPLMDGITPTIFKLINGATISDADMQLLQGGSVEFQDGTLWANLFTAGGLTDAPTLYVEQGGSKVAPFWSAGHIDVLIKVKEAGTPIADGLVTVYARQYGYTYDHYQVDLSGGGRNVAPVSTLIDANNSTAAEVVAAYNDITYTFGATTQDLGDGKGPASYRCVIDCAGRTLKEVYEHTKYVTRDASSATLNGVPGWRYQAADASYAANKASPFGTFAGGKWFVAQGVWLSNVASSDAFNYQLTDHAGVTHELAQPEGAVTASLMDNTRIVLFNETQGTEIDNVMVSGTYSKTITTQAATNDVLALHFFKEGYQEGKATLIWSGTTSAFVVNYVVDEVEAALAADLGITGAACTEFAADTVGHVYIEFNDSDGVTMKARLALWYKYILTTEEGARHFRGGLSLLSTAAFRINTAAVDMLLENVNPSMPVRFSDVQRRLYRDDGSSVIAPTSYSLHNDYSGVPDVVETGVSGLTGAESAQLMGLPTADATATAVWSSPARTLTESAGGLTESELELLTSLAQIHGLIPGTPLVVTPTSRTAGNISQTIAQVGDNVTVSRA